MLLNILSLILNFSPKTSIQREGWRWYESNSKLGLEWT